MIKQMKIENKFLKNELMSKHTSYRIGGPAKIFFTPANRDELIQGLEFSKSNKMNIFFIGSGSNLLVSDQGINGMVISIKKSFRYFSINNTRVFAETGTMLGRIVNSTIKEGLTGLESLVGVPGTLGGALIMNAGAYGSEISNYLKTVEVVTKEGIIKKYQMEDMKFSYRNSNFSDEEILISAEFELNKENKEEINKKKIHANKGRRSSQPLKFRSAGSVFKNPKEGPAGYFIEKAGLKGLRSGNAEISKKHANFFINYGDAKAEDLVKLILTAKKSVKKLFNINLELEIQTLGFKKGTFKL